MAYCTDSLDDITFVGWTVAAAAAARGECAGCSADATAAKTLMPQESKKAVCKPFKNRLKASEF